MMKIKTASSEDAGILARIIRRANIPVAETFGLTPDNAPSHPSLCTEGWVLEGMDRGEAYFILETGDGPAGCVAYESPEPDLAYLNRLAVLPEYQGQGYGRTLVTHVIDLAGRDKKKTISIGIIKAHGELASWYETLGFRPAGDKIFDHLPFDVRFMQYDLKKAVSHEC